MIEAARKRVPAWALGIALAAGIGIWLAMPVILDWWRLFAFVGIMGGFIWIEFKRTRK